MARERERPDRFDGDGSAGRDGDGGCLECGYAFAPGERVSAKECPSCGRELPKRGSRRLPERPPRGANTWS